MTFFLFEAGLDDLKFVLDDLDERVHDQFLSLDRVEVLRENESPDEHFIFQKGAVESAIRPLGTLTEALAKSIEKRVLSLPSLTSFESKGKIA